MLERYKTLYCVIVMAAGVILAARAGFIGWLAAVLILSFALPAWRAVTEVAKNMGYVNALRWAENHLQSAEDQDAL